MSEQDLDKLGSLQDFYMLWKDEKNSHKITKVFRNVFLIWAVCSSMIAWSLIWQFSRFTYVDPSTIAHEVIQQDGSGINNYQTEIGGDVVNGTEDN